ncbi:ankyrin repeat-containing domain protein [Paraphysoderma sedebokerense]|nr:ankyrin repeat-containing domain protein [Paraphysoderma sedebokerense]
MIASPENFDVAESVACARYGEIEELQALIQQYRSTHPDVAVRTLLICKDDFGNTALHMSSANGHTDIVKFILQYLSPFDINETNNTGNTALHWCCLNGQIETAELLIENGADITIKNDAGRTALYEAEQGGHSKIVDMILKNMSVDEEELEEGESDQLNLAETELEESPEPVGK